MAVAPLVFFDTNILVYFITRDDSRTAIADGLLARGGYISVHVLNETANVARRKLKMDWPEITGLLRAIRELCEPPVPLTVEIHEDALQIAARYRYNIYDSLVIACALKAGCSVLYSEDMQDGQRIDSLTIRNPFV